MKAAAFNVTTIVTSQRWKQYGREKSKWLNEMRWRYRSHLQFNIVDMRVTERDEICLCSLSLFLSLLLANSTTNSELNTKSLNSQQTSISRKRTVWTVSVCNSRNYNECVFEKIEILNIISTRVNTNIFPFRIASNTHSSTNQYKQNHSERLRFCYSINIINIINRLVSGWIVYLILYTTLLGIQNCQINSLLAITVIYR